MVVKRLTVIFKEKEKSPKIELNWINFMKFIQN